MSTYVSCLAHVCERYAEVPALVMREVSVARPGPGELLVNNRAFAVGFPDLLTVQGKYQRKPDLPFVPGSEFAGEVAALGTGVVGVKVGDKVMGSVLLGAYAAQVVARAAACFPLAPGFGFTEGAAFLTAYKTAYVGLVERGRLRRGETLLVLGASGGVGLAAVELGKVLGARVIAAASTGLKLSAARACGADATVDYSSGKFRDAVKTLTDGRGADVIYDPVGGDCFDEALHCIAPFGRFLVIGFAAGRIPQAPVNYALIKQISIIGVRAGEFGRLDPVGGARVNAALVRLASSGQLHPRIHAVYPFRDVVRALTAIAERTVIGRIVVDVQA
jgi:NADPH2:quinone reductase